MVRTFLNLLLIGIGGSMLVLFFKFNADSKNIKRNNGFVRKVRPNFITLDKYIQLNYNSYYLCGNTEHHLYLGNYKNPSEIGITDFSLAKLKYAHIEIPQTVKFAWRAANIFIDSPVVYLGEGISPKLLQGALGGLFLKDSINTGKRNFNSFLPISAGTTILNGYDKAKENKYLIKESDQQKPDTANNNTPLYLEKNREGIYSTDGTMIYDRKAGRIIFMYYYRNLYLCLDTNLNLLYKGNTIDTNTIAKISTDTIHSDKLITFSYPPLLVNHWCFADGNHLFIHSPQRADNELVKTFEDSDAIDVYDIIEKKYLFSFYIPRFMNAKQSDFRVSGNRLFVIFNNYLAEFNMQEFNK